MKKHLVFSVLAAALFTSAIFAAPASAMTTDMTAMAAGSPQAVSSDKTAPIWQWVTSSQYSTAYFDKNSVAYQNASDTSTVVVNLKEVFNKEGKEKIASIVTANGADSDLSTASYMIYGYAFNLTDNKAKLLSETLYDANGNVLYKFSMPQNAAFDDVDTLSDMVKDVFNGVKVYVKINQVGKYQSLAGEVAKSARGTDEAYNGNAATYNDNIKTKVK